MLKLLSEKALHYFIVIWVVVSLNFLLPRLMPGCPLEVLAGEEVWLLSPEARLEILQRHGLDRPLWEQYILYLRSLARGDLGYSFQWRARPVAQIMMERLPWTLLLTGVSLVLSTVVGVILGTIAGWKRGQRTDVANLSFFMWLGSMPSFWVGMVLVALFAVQFPIFPIFGARSPWVDYTGPMLVLDVLRHLVLPVATLTVITVSSNFLLMRYSMLDVLGQDYIFMAKGKGLSERTIAYKHAMRTALLPMATIVMLGVGFLVGGTVVIETVFAYPGVGRLMFEAVLARDFPLIQGIFLVISITVICGNIIADMIYPLLDPRVRRVGSEQ
jgi:peptide/nickel transport system permease protein